MSDRYNKTYTSGKVTFTLSEFTPDIEECKLLMLKVLEQAIRDYQGLIDNSSSSDKELWKSARDFLFDDEYMINWGGLYLRTEEFLDILDLDIQWVRSQVKKKINGENNDRTSGEE